MSEKASTQRDALIGRITECLAGNGLCNSELFGCIATRQLLEDMRTYLLSQTYWPQGIGKPKRDYSGDWKRRLR